LEIRQSFTVERPLGEVWALFQDVPTVARCMPGAELLEDKGSGAYRGRVSIKLGPFNAAFEGEAQVTPDAASHSGHVEGRGTDKRGGSRSKLVLDYRLIEVDGGTEVTIVADIQLSGPIAQFGRTGIITETANILIRQFVQNVEAKLAPAAPTASAGALAGPAPVAAAATDNRIGVFGLVGALVGSFFRQLFGEKFDRRP
jgi:uncharacterized protein